MRTLLAAALVAALATAPASAAPSSAGAAPRDVRVAGRAGEVATFVLDRPTRIGRGGSGVTVTAPGATWSGVAITRLDSPPSSDGMDTYVYYRLHDRMLCPGEHCAPEGPFQPNVATADDGNGYALLRPGRYGVALLGPRGAGVTAALHLVGPRRGRANLRTARAAAYETTTFAPAVSGPGGDLASRGFARFDGKGRHVVDSLAIGFVLPRPSAIHYVICATDGGRRQLDGTGGTVPCRDGDGDDHVLRPETHPVPYVESGTKRVGIAWIVTAGRARDDAGLGYEAGIAGADGRIAALHFAVAF